MKLKDLNEVLRADSGALKPGQKVTIKKTGKTYTLVAFMSKGGDRVNPWEKWETEEEGRKDGGVLFHVYGGKPDSHYNVLSIQRQVNVFKMSKEDRAELRKVTLDSNDDKAFIDFCSKLNKNNGYTRLDVDVFADGESERDIIRKIKSKKVKGMPPVISGEIVKVGGVPFLKLQDGNYEEL